MHDATRAIRAVLSATEQGSAFSQGPVFAAAYHAAGDPAAVPFTYGRFHNPTWSAYEAALTELEGAPSLVFASGMAAMTAVWSTMLKPSDTLMLPSDSYYTGRVIADNHFAALGIQVKRAPTVNNGLVEALQGARLVWIESPTNPGLDVCDVRAVVEAAHAAGALVAIDNTTATPLGQNPIALGADFSVASDTKALTGHSDLVLGHVSCRDKAHYERLHAWRTQTGSIAGPMEVWLALRSLATLELRLERQNANALAIAKFLSAQPIVKDVRYPGLSTDAAHAIAKTQMQRFGSVVSFTLPSRAHAENFLSACKLVTEATSFGSIHTTAERRARWGGDAIPEGFIRFSAGCEAAADLIADLEQALGGLTNT